MTHTTDLFVPPAAEGLPLAALDSATAGADRLDAMARTPTGRNFLAHALVQLARDGWLRTVAGEGFEPMRDRETPEPASAAVPVSPPADRAAVLREAADAVARHTGNELDANAKMLRRMAAGEQQQSEAAREIVHGCPPDGSGLTPCCGRTPFELPLGDRISSEAPITCSADGPSRVAAEEQPTERPRCPHCQLPHDLTPGSLPVAACASIRAQIAAEDAARPVVEEQPDTQETRRG